MAFVGAPATAGRRPRQGSSSSSCASRRSPCLARRTGNVARWTCCVESAAAAGGKGQEDDLDFRPHGGLRDDVGDNAEDFLPIDLVDGYLDNAKVRPKIDIDADEYMLMWKLRKMLHEDDFNKIFDKKSRIIGEF